MQEQGEPISLEELCADCPELLSEVQQRVSKLKILAPMHTAGHADSVTSLRAPGDAPAPPDIPGFEIVSVLGEGGMGIVYQARQLALNRLVALKIISAQNTV